MASQQIERCLSVEIQNDVLSRLIHAGLSGTEWSLTFAVIHQLKCRDGKAVSISLREFHDLVNLDEESIRKGLKTLRDRSILIQHEPPSFTKAASWCFNDNWRSWDSSCSMGVLRQHTPPRQHTESPIPAQRGVLSEHTVSFSPAPEVPANAREKPQEGAVSASATMNNINTPVVSFEKNKSSTRCSPSTAAVTLAGQLRDSVRVRDPKAKAARTEDLTGWARDIDLLIRIDQRSPDEIRRVIEWCQVPGGFWGPNILSGRKLREKFDTLSGQMMRETSEARYERRNGNYRVPQILNNRAEREYIPVREPVRI